MILSKIEMEKYCERFGKFSGGNRGGGFSNTNYWSKLSNWLHEKDKLFRFSGEAGTESESCPPLIRWDGSSSDVRRAFGFVLRGICQVVEVVYESDLPDYEVGACMREVEDTRDLIDLLVSIEQVDAAMPALLGRVELMTLRLAVQDVRFSASKSGAIERYLRGRSDAGKACPSEFLEKFVAMKAVVAKPLPVAALEG